MRPREGDSPGRKAAITAGAEGPFDESGRTNRCGLVGAPGEGVGRAAGDPVDLLSLQRNHQAGSLDGIGGAVAELALVVVAPGEDLALIAAGDAVKRPGRDANDLLTLKGCDLARVANVLVGAVSESVIVSLAPARPHFLLT